MNILVLDEPTATLSPQESILLFQELRRLASDGLVVVVVSHKLPEVVANAVRFTVLRSGKVAESLLPAQTSTEQLAQLIAGERQLGTVQSSARRISATGQNVISLRGVSVAARDTYELGLAEINLTVRRREILGIAGRPGSGAVTLLDLLSGRPAPVISGELAWHAPDGKLARSAIVGLVPADGARGAAVPSFTVASNLALRRRTLWRFGGILPALKRFAMELIDRYQIHPPRPEQPLASLSGGNVQKTLLAREIEHAQDLLVVVNPTAGLDIAAAQAIRRMIIDKAAADIAVVVSSEDLDELVEICERVVVLSRGRVVAVLASPMLTREGLGQALAEESPAVGSVAPPVQQPSESVGDVP